MNPSRNIHNAVNEPNKTLLGSEASTPKISNRTKVQEARHKNDEKVPSRWKPDYKPPPVLHLIEHFQRDSLTGILLPMANLWRYFSDQLEREDARDANKKQDHPPAPERKLSPNPPYNHDEASEDFVLPDELCDCREEYLDPDLVRRAHRDYPFDIPKEVAVEQREDAPKSPMSGLMEKAHEGKFARVWGSGRAREAIAKGDAAVVKCDSCSRKYNVAQSASALYCRNCDAVTQLDARSAQLDEASVESYDDFWQLAPYPC